MLNIKPKKFWFAVLALLVLVFIAIPALDNSPQVKESPSLENQTTSKEEPATAITVFAIDSLNKLSPAAADTKLKVSIYGENAEGNFSILSENTQQVEAGGSFPVPPIEQGQYLKIEALNEAVVQSDTPLPSASVPEPTQIIFALLVDKYPLEQVVDKGLQDQTVLENDNKKEYAIFYPKNIKEKQVLVLGADRPKGSEGRVSVQVIDESKLAAVVTGGKEEIDNLDPKLLLKPTPTNSPAVSPSDSLEVIGSKPLPPCSDIRKINCTPPSPTPKILPTETPPPSSTSSPASSSKGEPSGQPSGQPSIVVPSSSSKALPSSSRGSSAEPTESGGGSESPSSSSVVEPTDSGGVAPSSSGGSSMAPSSSGSSQPSASSSARASASSSARASASSSVGTSSSPSASASSSAGASSSPSPGPGGSGLVGAGQACGYLNRNLNGGGPLGGPFKRCSGSLMCCAAGASDSNGYANICMTPEECCKKGVPFSEQIIRGNNGQISFRNYSSTINNGLYSMENHDMNYYATEGGWASYSHSDGYMNTFYDHYKGLEDLKNRVEPYTCCNLSLNAPTDSSNLGLVRAYSAPYPPSGSNKEANNWNKFGYCAPPCNINLINYINSSQSGVEFPGPKPPFETKVCARISCSKNKTDSWSHFDPASISSTNGQFKWLESNFDWVPLGKGSLCEFEDGSVKNGNEDGKALPSCTLGKQNKLIGTGKIGDLNNYKEYYCCRTGCAGDDDKDFTIVAKGGGSTCEFKDGSRPNGNAVPHCLPQSQCDIDMESGNVTETKACFKNYPSSCPICKEKPDCPTCSGNKELDEDMGECSCRQGIVQTCSASGGSLNEEEDCGCETLPANLSGTFRFSQGASDSGYSDYNGESGSSKRPMLSSEYKPEENKKEETSDYRQVNPNPDMKLIGFIYPPCSYGEERDFIDNLCKPIISTKCSDGRISSISGGCTATCEDPNMPGSYSRENCKCLTEQCCKLPQIVDPISKICTCPEKLTKKRGEPTCPVPTDKSIKINLDKESCWCKRDFDGVKRDYDRPTCVNGTFDPRSCSCVASANPPPVSGSKTFSEYSCTYECEGDNARAEKRCRLAGGTFDAVSCGCSGENNVDPEPSASASASASSSVVSKASASPSSSVSSSVSSSPSASVSNSASPIASASSSPSNIPEKSASSIPSSSPSEEPSKTPSPIKEPPLPPPPLYQVTGASIKGKKLTPNILIKDQTGQLTISSGPRLFDLGNLELLVSIEGMKCPNSLASFKLDKKGTAVLKARVPSAKRDLLLEFSVSSNFAIVGKGAVPYSNSSKKKDKKPFTAKEINKFCKALERF